MKAIHLVGLIAGVFILFVNSTYASELRVEQALEEYEQALSLTPDIENGRKLYQKCAVCHDPEGWGRKSGNYPQIAGQLRTVIIKQLADIRAGNRGNPMMYPFTTGRVLRGSQDIADVSAYVSQLKMTPDNGTGSPNRYASGQQLYGEYCSDCHGESGEGDHKKHIPMIQGQHFNYLMRQFNWIKIGRRTNADKEMVEQIQSFHQGDIYDVLSYVSFLKPPKDKIAENLYYRNPDFYNRYSRKESSNIRTETQRLTQEQQKKEGN